MVTFGSRLFPNVGGGIGGMASMTDHLGAFWLCVHDVSVKARGIMVCCCHCASLQGCTAGYH